MPFLKWTQDVLCDHEEPLSDALARERRAAGESAPGTSEPTMTCGCHFEASTSIKAPLLFLLSSFPL